MDYDTAKKEVKQYLQKIKKLFVQPEEFFKSIAKENIKPSLIYYSCFLVINLILSLPIVIKILEPELPKYNISLGPLVYAGVLIVGVVYSYLEILFSAGITFLLARLFKGTNNFIETAKVIIYGATPEYLLQIVLGVFSLFAFPQLKAVAISIIVINAAIVAYRVYIQTIGISLVHRITKIKAVLAVFVIPYAIIFLVLMLLQQFLPIPTATP